MGVKTIFKTLLGTAILIVCASLYLEIQNISLTSSKLTSTVVNCLKQSATYFCQETYKTDTDIGFNNNLKDADGNVYVGGSFYNVNSKVAEVLDAKDVYNRLYSLDGSSEFGTWYNTGNYTTLVEDASGTKNQPVTVHTYLGTSSSIGEQSNYEETSISNLHNQWQTLDAIMGNTDKPELTSLYRNTMMTPANLGIPFVDQNTLTRIFRWQLTQVLQNCNPAAIMKDNRGDSYVAYNGFRVYTDEAVVTDITYTIYDLTTLEGNIAFYNDTQIWGNRSDSYPEIKAFADDPANNITSKGLSLFTNDTSLVEDINAMINYNDTNSERTTVATIAIKYDVPVAYNGVSPIGKIYVWTQGNTVRGYSRSDEEPNEAPDYSSDAVWNDDKGSLEAGGLTGNENVATIAGRCIYYIVR